MDKNKQLPPSRAVGTVQLAAEFADAASRQNLHRQFSMVPYFLAGHALELALKAILVVHGTTEERLRGHGHDLEECHAAVCALHDGGAPQLSAEDVARLHLLAPVYKSKSLEYVQPGYYRLPAAPELVEATTRFVSATQSWVGRRVRAVLANDDAV